MGTNSGYNDDSASADRKTGDFAPSHEGQDESEIDVMSPLVLDLERLIGSIEQRRAQIQIQGRALTAEEMDYLDRTSAAFPHLEQALEQLIKQGDTPL
jgi:hypothetical protein